MSERKKLDRRAVTREEKVFLRPPPPSGAYSSKHNGVGSMQFQTSCRAR